MPKRKRFIAGRPPKENPMEVVGSPERFLVTWPVKQAVDELLAMFISMGINNRSDVHRLALYMLIKKYDMLTPELQEDPTFKNLRDLGLV